MMLMLNNFFNNPNCWLQTGIVFTKCYKGYFKKEPYQSQYKKIVCDFIKTLNNCQNINPPIPCFFVDSSQYLYDESTKLEFNHMIDFTCKNKPILTNNFVPVRPDYKSIEEETLYNQVVEKKQLPNGGIETRCESFKRIKYTCWDRSIRYSKHEVFDSFTIQFYCYGGTVNIPSHF